MSSNLLAMKSASKQTDCAFEAGRINLLQLIETLKTVIFCSARFCQCSFKLKSLEEKKNNNNNKRVRYRYYDQQRLSSLFQSQRECKPRTGNLRLGFSRGMSKQILPPGYKRVHAAHTRNTVLTRGTYSSHSNHTPTSEQLPCPLQPQNYPRTWGLEA